MVNHKHLWYVITHPMPTFFNQTAVEVGTWMNNHTPLFNVDIITYPCPKSDAGLASLIKRGHWEKFPRPWWRYQMETFSALLAHCEGNSPVTSGFPSQRPVTRSFDVVFDLRLNKRLSKPSRRRCFETPSRSLWRHRNAVCELIIFCVSRQLSCRGMCKMVTWIHYNFSCMSHRYMSNSNYQRERVPGYIII